MLFFRTKDGKRSNGADAAASESDNVVASSQGVFLFKLASHTLIN